MTVETAGRYGPFRQISLLQNQRQEASGFRHRLVGSRCVARGQQVGFAHSGSLYAHVQSGDSCRHKNGATSQPGR